MKWILLSGVLIGLAFVVGCTMPTPCVPSEMGAPGNLSPANYALVSLSPSLTWEYPPSVPSPYPYPYPSGSSDCAISGYRIHLYSSTTGPEFELGGEVSGSSTHSFTPGSTLTPATLYFWEVRALSGAGAGPWSGIRAFYTGPVCATSSLAAPSLYYPAGVIHTLHPIFYWSYPGIYSPGACLPQGFRIDVSTDPSFSDTSLSGGTGNPRMEWTTAGDLQDCTDYYWRVAAINDTTLGPFSPTQSFTTQVGLCIVMPIFIPRTNANCRIGPNTLYGRLAVLNPGDQLPVVGRHQTEDGNWYVVQYNNLECWVAERTGDLQGDPELIAFREPPPLPLPSGGSDDNGASCGSITSSNECNSTPGCSYDIRSKSCKAN